MMKEGRFLASKNESIKLLETAGLLNEKETPNYRDLDVSSIRGKNHRETYEYVFRNRFYDVLLKDMSIIQYRNDTQEESYSFIPSPDSIPPIEDFLAETIGAEFYELDDIERDEFIEQSKPDYMMYIETIAQPNDSLYIRYDKHLEGYREGHHPAAHIHIGFNSPVRIGLDRLQTPMSFTLFVLRHIFTGEWKKLLEDDELVEKFSRSVRHQLEIIQGEFFNQKDACELYLK